MIKELASLPWGRRMQRYHKGAEHETAGMEGRWKEGMQNHLPYRHRGCVHNICQKARLRGYSSLYWEEQKMKRILLVEDDRHHQVLIRDELTDEGYEVVIASDAAEAMSLILNAAGRKPDLIIFDIRMTRMDGIETLGRIIKERMDAPIIIHSAYSGYRDHTLVIAADAYIVKTHDLSTLKSAISFLLEKRGISTQKKVLQLSASFGKVFLESVPGSNPLCHDTNME
jgi:two-component system, response regulator, stage 0 sporulation protein F